MTEVVSLRGPRATPHLADLRDEATRARLSRDGFPPVLRLLDSWQLTVEEKAELLDLTPRTLQRYQKDGPATLSVDQLTRMSLLVGIGKALRLLHSPENAAAWPKRPNRRPLFRGAPPLETMLGGIPALMRVRRLLDADRGGVTERQDPDIEAQAARMVEASLAQLQGER